MDKKKSDRSRDADLVEVFNAHGEVEAQLVRSVLEGDGIDAMLAGESVRLTHGITIDGLAEVRILVRPEDAERARELIDTIVDRRK